MHQSLVVANQRVHIGKQGHTAKSLRIVLNAVATRTTRKVVLEIIED
jgi:predicted RNA-binding protein YlqC (UPF0109 family)